MLEKVLNIQVMVQTWSKSSYLQDLVGTAHGCDFMVSMRTAKFAEVTHRSATHLTVHVNFLHLVLRTHQHLQSEKLKFLLLDQIISHLTVSINNYAKQDMLVCFYQHWWLQINILMYY